MRAWIIVACLGGLVVDGALWSHDFATGEVLTARLQFYPERMLGEVVTLPLVRVEEVRVDGYTVRQGRFPWRIQGDPRELAVGEEIYVRGTLVAPGRIAASWHERAPERGGKKLLGFLGLAIAGGVVLAGCRLERDGVVVRG
jgi:hypothetical protein